MELGPYFERQMAYRVKMSLNKGVWLVPVVSQVLLLTDCNQIEKGMDCPK